MAYNEYLQAGYPIASGVIEGACRHVVKDRMERSGMRWILDGAQAMLGLRCIHLSGSWDEFIRFRIKREKLSDFTQDMLQMMRLMNAFRWLNLTRG
jgi:hypothetical protein